MKHLSFALALSLLGCGSLRDYPLDASGDRPPTDSPDVSARDVPADQPSDISPADVPITDVPIADVPVDAPTDGHPDASLFDVFDDLPSDAPQVDAPLGADADLNTDVTITCPTDLANCDMIAANGCEVNTQTDAMHCGGCGRACVTPPNAMPLCRGGMCDFTCLPGFSDCDRNPTNGCETDLNADPENCRMCGMACPAAPGRIPTCAAGVCGTRMGICPSGLGDCDGQETNGCETNTNAAIGHCGGCGRACSFANAEATCLAGQCVIGPCSGAFRNCDGDQTNGCEVNINTSTMHCGRCGGSCVPPNGTPACVSGACGIASCNTGFADCNGAPSDGCEVDTRTSTSHCGACNNACRTGEQCISDRCTLVCPTNFTNCAGTCRDLSSDRANCGACGRACATWSSCNAGQCCGEWLQSCCSGVVCSGDISCIGGLCGAREGWYGWPYQSWYAQDANQPARYNALTWSLTGVTFTRPVISFNSGGAANDFNRLCARLGMRCVESRLWTGDAASCGAPPFPNNEPDMSRIARCAP